MTRLPAILSLAATPAHAAFGAIAYAAGTGAYGVGWNAPSRGEAARLAVETCAAYGAGCAVTLSFENACGALATRDRLIHASASAPALAEAEAAALAACGRLSAAGCEIEVSFCSNR